MNVATPAMDHTLTAHLASPMALDAVWTLQVSSLLSATYSIPWPPFYEKIIDAFAAVNIDISMIRQVHHGPPFGQCCALEQMASLCRRRRWFLPD